MLRNRNYYVSFRFSLFIRFFAGDIFPQSFSFSTHRFSKVSTIFACAKKCMCKHVFLPQEIKRDFYGEKRRKNSKSQGVVGAFSLSTFSTYTTTSTSTTFLIYFIFLFKKEKRKREKAYHTQNRVWKHASFFPSQCWEGVGKADGRI